MKKVICNRQVRLMVAGLFASVSASMVQAQTPPSDSATIKGVRAFFYYEDSGTFDQRDIAQGVFTLKNVRTGGGDAKAPSNATLVLIDLDRTRLSGKSLKKLELVATVGKQTLFKGVAPLEKGNDGDPMAIPFIVHGTGCDPVKLTVHLLDKSGRTLTSTVRTLDFSCWYD